MTDLEHYAIATMFQERVYDLLDRGFEPHHSEIVKLRLEVARHRRAAVEIDTQWPPRCKPR